MQIGFQALKIGYLFPFRFQTLLLFEKESTREWGNHNNNLGKK